MLKSTYSRLTTILYLFLAFSVFAFVIMKMESVGRIASHREQFAKAPPFPQVIHGKRIQWVPDEIVRSMAGKIQPSRVDHIIVANVRVEKASSISQLITALNKSVRLKGDPFHESGHGSVLAPQFLLIFFRSDNGVQRDPLEIICYPDLYEGQFPGMDGGTFCPEFQDAMRNAGIPNQYLLLNHKKNPWIE